MSIRWTIGLSALVCAWTAGMDTAAAQSCTTNAECASGYVCGAQGLCEAGAAVTVQGSAGDGQVTGQVVVQQPQPQPQPQPQSVPPPGYAPQPVYAQPQPAPPPPRYEERPIWGLIIPGISMLAAGYVVNVLVSLIGGAVIGFDTAVTGTGYSGNDFFYTGLIPAAGPFVQMAVTRGDEGWLPYLLVDGLIQTAGLTMIILGAVLRTSERVAAIELDDGVRLTFAPAPTQGGMAIASSLTF